MDVRGWTPARFHRSHHQMLHPDLMEAAGGGLRALSLSGQATVAYPLANLAYYIPIQITEPVTLLEAFWENGTGASAGDVDIGLYDAAGTRLMSLGSGVARGAASSIITTTTMTNYTVEAAGLYYMAFSHSATNNIFGAPITLATMLEALGIFEETSAHPLPATATFAHSNRTYLPKFGLLITTAIAMG